MKINNKNFFAAIIGNMLDRYDMALYGLMAAFIAPSFFPSEDPIVGIIKAYGVMALGILTRPIGSLLFGKLAMQIGARKVMIICLTGVAFSTGSIGLIPSYESIGPNATFIFIVIRIIQGIFAAGENTVAPFFLIQNSEITKSSRVSGFYNFSTMFGVLIASVCATIVGYSNNPEYYWRYAFFAGFFTAIFGLILRNSMMHDNKEHKIKVNLFDILSILNRNKTSLIRIVFVSSFSYITYTIPFVFMNNFVPEITNISLPEMLQLNSVLLVLDTMLIPIFGIISENFNRAKFMAFMSAFVAISVIPLFYYIQGSNFLYIMIVRMIIIIAGLAFLAPIQAWYYSLFKGSERYLMIGFGYSIGEEIIGRNSTAICLWLWYNYNTPIAPAIFITVVALLATIALLTTPKIKPRTN
jgi:MFS-type transporter involved in bile tolerance (Atg22 family)